MFWYDSLFATFWPFSAIFYHFGKHSFIVWIMRYDPNVFEHDCSTFHLKLIQVYYDELKKSGLQNTDNFWRHPCGKINHPEARGQFPKQGFHWYFELSINESEKLTQYQFDTLSQPWHPRHGLKVMNRIQNYVTKSTGHQFSTKKMSIDLLRRTYLNLLQKMGFSDLQQEQRKTSTSNLFHDMKIGKFHNVMSTFIFNNIVHSI